MRAARRSRRREALIDNPSYFPWGCDAQRQTVRTADHQKRGGKVYSYGGPFPCLTYTTMRDLLDAKSVSWKFYADAGLKVADGPEAGIWSAFDAIKAVRYSSEWNTNVTRTNLDIFTDISNHRLPAVSWITPDGANSDHPAEQKRYGSVVGCIDRQRDRPEPYWDSTAIVVVWDDWGGFYDHVSPPHPRNWQGGPGFRVPMLIVSPYVKPHVDHTVYQFGSILRFVGRHLEPGVAGKQRRRHSTSIGNAFDFQNGAAEVQSDSSRSIRATFSCIRSPRAYRPTPSRTENAMHNRAPYLLTGGSPPV